MVERDAAVVGRLAAVFDLITFPPSFFNARASRSTMLRMVPLSQEGEENGWIEENLRTPTEAPRILASFHRMGRALGRRPCGGGMEFERGQG